MMNCDDDYASNRRQNEDDDAADDEACQRAEVDKKSAVRFLDEQTVPILPARQVSCQTDFFRRRAPSGARHRQDQVLQYERSNDASALESFPDVPNAYAGVSQYSTEAEPSMDPETGQLSSSDFGGEDDSWQPFHRQPAAAAAVPVGRHSPANDARNHDRETPELDLQKASAMLVRELNDMSMEERERAYEDLHGVTRPAHENLATIQTLLVSMNYELAQTPLHQRQAIGQAIRQDRSYVQDRAFMISFLRAERYSAPRAASRMCRYFEQKLEMFGCDLLAKDVTLGDLDMRAVQAIESGYLQLLPRRDSAGRAVLFSAIGSGCTSDLNVDRMLKMYWYTISAAIEDPETQMRPPVFVAYCVGSERADDVERQALSRCRRIFECLPFRFSGVHCCYDDHNAQAYVSTLMSAVGKDHRARLHVHHGHHAKCRFVLKTFGIPEAVLPIDSEGNVRMKEHYRWTARRRAKEADMALSGLRRFPGIDLPANRDVLLGRGKPYQQHPGNLFMLQVVHQNQQAYDEQERGSKPEIGRRVLRRIKRETHARFLQRRQDGWWFEVSDDVAIDKICYSFRNFRTRQTSSTSVRPSGPQSPDVATGFAQRDAKRPKIDGDADSSSDCSQGPSRP